MAELEALVSLPLGRPLHRHHGHIEVDDTSVTLIEGDNRKTIQKSEISGPQVSYDDHFTIADSNFTIADSKDSPPMHFSFGNDEVYIFTEGARLGFWQGENAALSEAIVRR